MIVPIEFHGTLGRQMYLPPNSAANSFYLQMLRYMLVQDWDADDDGRADTLRLLFATPRKWLADAKEIDVGKAPTQFGSVSVTARSNLSKGEVTAQIELPEKAPPHVLLRLRLPDGKKIKSVTANGHPAKLLDDVETLDLSGVSGRVNVEARVTR